MGSLTTVTKLPFVVNSFDTALCCEMLAHPDWTGRTAVKVGEFGEENYLMAVHVNRLL